MERGTFTYERGGKILTQLKQASGNATNKNESSGECSRGQSHSSTLTILLGSIRIGAATIWILVGVNRHCSILICTALLGTQALSGNRIPPNTVTVVRNRVAIFGIIGLDGGVRRGTFKCRSTARAIEACAPVGCVEVAHVEQRWWDNTSIRNRNILKTIANLFACIRQFTLHVSLISKLALGHWVLHLHIQDNRSCQHIASQHHFGYKLTHCNSWALVTTQTSGLEVISLMTSTTPCFIAEGSSRPGKVVRWAIYA